MMELSVGCFNLVIEGLLVSSAEDAKKYVHDKLKFQSRNRGTFGFKDTQGFFQHAETPIVSIS